MAVWSAVLKAAGALRSREKLFWGLLMGLSFIRLFALLLPSVFEKILSHSFGTVSTYRGALAAEFPSGRRRIALSLCASYVLFVALFWMLHVTTYASLITKNYMW